MSVFSLPSLLSGPLWKGKRVGLLGGSFNPPHEGHVHISLAALKGLELDAIWWLVSPQNPLKSLKAEPLADRMALCHALVQHPKILISDIETSLGTTMTYHTVKKLKKRFPHTPFVWISGMDNALTFHHWNYWQELLSEICMVHLTRNPAKTLVKSTPYRMLSHQKHVFIDKGGALPLDTNTTYWMLQKKIMHLSSTELRQTQTLHHIG